MCEHFLAKFSDLNFSLKFQCAPPSHYLARSSDSRSASTQNHYSKHTVPVFNTHNLKFKKKEYSFSAGRVRKKTADQTTGFTLPRCSPRLNLAEPASCLVEIPLTDGYREILASLQEESFLYFKFSKLSLYYLFSVVEVQSAEKRPFLPFHSTAKIQTKSLSRPAA